MDSIGRLRAAAVCPYLPPTTDRKSVLDRVASDKDTTLITRGNGEDAVVMSLDTYNSLMETLHLLQSPANIAHLQRSIAQ